MKSFLWLWNANCARTIAVLAIVLSIVVLGRFARYVKLASSHDIDASLIPQILACNLPQAMVLLLPLALMFGMGMLMVRLHHDGELSAWYNSGFSRARLARVLISPSLVLLPVSLMLALFWSPLGKMRAQSMLDQPSKGFWLEHISTSALTAHKGRLIFADVLEHGVRYAKLGNVRVAGTDKQGNEILTVSRNGSLMLGEAREVYLSLDKGSIYRDAPGTARLRVSRFGNLKRSLGKIDRRSRRHGDTLEMVPLIQLWRMDSTPALVETLWRLSIGLAAPILAAVALVAMGGGIPRRNWRASGLLYILLGYWSYVSALAWARDWGLVHSAEVGTLDMVALFSTIPLIALLLTYAVWRRQVHN
jgi:lipopolysaccharide export LptBFGC system permease protein LptF